MKKSLKSLFFIFIILAILIGLSSASAADMDVNVNSFNDIQTAIDSANEGDSLYLKSEKYTSNGDAIKVTKNNLSFIGSYDGNQKSTLDADYKSGIFEVGTYELGVNFITIKNLNFIKSSDSAIITYGDNTSVIDCSFNDNRNLYDDGYASVGGAMYISGENATVVDSVFINNRAEFGGAIFTEDKNTHILNSTFIDDTVINNGGAIQIGWMQSSDNTVVQNLLLLIIKQQTPMIHFIPMVVQLI